MNGFLQSTKIALLALGAAGLIPMSLTALAASGVLGRVGSRNLERPGGEVPEAAMAFAPFAERLGISWDEEFVYIEGNGLPEHGMMRGITAWQQQVPIPHDFTGPQGAFRIPLKPVLLAKAEELTLIGPIALAVNGIPIFHSLTQSGKDAKEGGELDEWGGHCGRADDYHYHIAPGHLEAVVGKGNPVAYGLDGFPVYMADPSKDGKLDECHGYFDEDGNYRYVSGDEAPYMMGMFRGAVDLDVRPRTGGVRPYLQPLRGAVITGFEGTLEGYDESDGDTGNQDAAPHKGDNPVDIFGMGERAVAFMEKSARAGAPLYVQMSYHALHYPENASPEAVAKYEKKAPGRIHRDVARAAITDDLDRGVGLLLEKLGGLGLRGNTYVIYMSDNGGGGGGGGKGGGARPIVGGKGSVWEGGIRVPLIVRGPGIEANSWCHERVVGYDLFPTLCALAGVREAVPEGVEGGNIAHLLRGEAGPVARPREELVFHFPHYQGDSPHSAILLGNFKLMKFYETGETRLYELADDIGERNDLAAKMPEKAGELEARLMAYLEAVGAELPVPNPDHVPGTTYEKKGGKGDKGKGKGKGGEGRRPPAEN